MSVEEVMVIYDKAREGFLDGTCDADADTIVAKLVKDYTPSSSSHETLADLTAAGGVVLSTSAALAGKIVTDGILRSDDVTFVAPAAGDTGTAIVLVDTSVDVPDGGRLLCSIGRDAEGALLNIETTGDDILYRPGAGTGKWFKL